jgi:serine/threonine protein kinase
LATNTKNTKSCKSSVGGSNNQLTSFSTVWLSIDTAKQTPIALKIVKSAQHYTETALDEIKLLQKVVMASASLKYKQYVVELFDSFRVNGPNGSHVVMGFEVLGANLLTLIKKYDNRGIDIDIVKRISKQVLMGLHYLHNDCGIIHTDLKPENILIQITDQDDVYRTVIQLDQSIGKLYSFLPNEFILCLNHFSKFANS